MTALPATVNRPDEVCSCGLPPVVRIDERSMCGHCFHLGISAAQSHRLHRWSRDAASPDEPSIEEVVRAALDEFELLERKVEIVLRKLEAK
ncbi:MAG TPA: hypothetical protein VMS56_00030 [Thermoanaerobaculia bacterium]|nr:hypothetical protein [Thermoanaerobaculia bacterium]